MEKTFGAYVRQRRLDAGLTQQELGEDIGYSSKVAQTRVSEIENDKKYPDAGLRRELSRALGVTHIDLLIAAGEIRRDEIPMEGAPRPLFSSADPRLPLATALQALPENGPREFYRLLAAMLLVVPTQLEEESR